MKLFYLPSENGHLLYQILFKCDLPGEGSPDFRTFVFAEVIVLDSEDDFRSGCRNVSQQQQQQHSPSLDYLHPQDHT